MVVLTGASSGIGEALAHKLGDAGAVLILVARSVEKLEEIKSNIESRGGKAFVYGCDLSNGESTNALVQSVNDAHGTIDILVNNAGMSIRRSVSKSHERIHDFERTMVLNFFGSLRLIMGFVPKMREQKSGRIVNVSTLGVQVGVPRFGAYIASKSALDAFSRILAAEAFSDGIRVTTVYMPLVKTPMMESTTMYQSFPMRTASEGADLIIDGIVNDKPRVTMPTGVFLRQRI